MGMIRNFQWWIFCAVAGCGGPSEGQRPAVPEVPQKRVERPAPAEDPKVERPAPTEDPRVEETESPKADAAPAPVEHDVFQEPVPGPAGFALPNAESLRPLVQAGDLPSEFSGGPIEKSAPPIFRNLPKADLQVFQQIVVGDRRKGGVGVFLYRHPARRDAAYRFLAKGIGPVGKEPFSEVSEAPAGLGKRGLVDISIPASRAVKGSGTVLFQRCSAVVHLVVGNDPDASAAVSFAQRLDERLTSIVCSVSAGRSKGTKAANEKRAEDFLAKQGAK